MASLMSAMWSSEQARWTAPLKSPSSLTATREVSDSSGSYNWVLMAATSVWRGWGRVLIWLLKFLTRSYQRPPLFGAQRQWAPEQKRRSHEGGSFRATTASITEVSLLVASSRKARRILLISFTEFLGTDAGCPPLAICCNVFGQICFIDSFDPIGQWCITSCERKGAGARASAGDSAMGSDQTSPC